MENKIPNIFRIPQVSTGEVSSAIIGILDSSGSMSSYWAYAARSWNNISKNHPNAYVITFSKKAAQRQIPLTERIEHYDCSSTNICAGFEVLNNLLKNPKIGENVTIIFISDGQDDNPSTLASRIIQLSFPLQKKINFISIGVGSGFPTFIAMNLREIYHNGESSLPPVFLIDKPNDEDLWSSNFKTLLPYTFHSAKVPITNAVKFLPWLPETKEIYENSWIICNEDKVTVNRSIQVEKMETLTPDELIDIAKGWLSELQISSLKKDKNTKEYATECLRILNSWKSKFIDSKNESAKLTFNKRIQKKLENIIQHNIQVIFKEIKQIADNDNLNQLSEVEAAKRLAIGTQIGKYHNAAMQLKGITVSDYIEARDHFINVYKQTFLSNDSDQEVSVISLQNQKDVFKEADLIEGLKSCPNQYDLVENFPIVGHAIKVKRSDGAMINPFMIKILSIAKHHKIVDTVSLQSANNELVMKIGDDDKETINCVIPLFSKVDNDLKPLINTKLFHILMTFNVMGNADTCFQNAYLGLLANTCFFLLNQTQSGWSDHMLNLVTNTLSMTYSDLKEYKKYEQTLIDTPRIAVITEHPYIETKCEDLTKAILVLFNLVQTKQLTNPDKIHEILLAIYSEAYGRNYSHEIPLDQFFQVNLPDNISLPNFEEDKKSVIDNFPELETFYTKQEMREELTRRVKDLGNNYKRRFKTTIKFLISKCEFMNYNKISILALNNIYKYFLPDRELPGNEKLMCWTVHASKYRNSHERNTTEINYNYIQILQELRAQRVSQIFKIQKIFEDSFLILNEKFKNYITETHQTIQTMTQEDLIAYCRHHKLDPSVYQLDPVSQLLKNACMAPKCPHFMKPSFSLAEHLESNLDKNPPYWVWLTRDCLQLLWGI